MNIIIIRKECGIHKGGAERYCLTLIKGLKKLNHNVILIGEFCDTETQRYVDFIPVKSKSLLSSISNLRFHKEVQKRLVNYKDYIIYSLSRTYPVDIYRVTDPLHIHHITINYNNKFKKIWTNISYRHRVLLDLEYKSLKNAKLIITISKLDKKLVESYYHINPKKIKVIYNGVDQHLFTLKVKDFRKTVRQQLGINNKVTCYLFPAMDFKRKGLNTLLLALTNIKFPFKLLVAGNGPIKKYKKKAKQLGIADKIIFLGRCKDIEKLYGACDLMVLPTTYDPFGNVHLEALACGLPVLTTAQAGGSEIVIPNKTGYIMKDCFSVEELVNYLNDFESKKHLWPNWSIAASKSIKNFTIERNIKQNIELLKQIKK